MVKKFILHFLPKAVRTRRGTKEKGVLCILKRWVTETLTARRGLVILNTGTNPGKGWAGLTRRLRGGGRDGKFLDSIRKRLEKLDSDFDFVIYCMFQPFSLKERLPWC